MDPKIINFQNQNLYHNFVKRFWGQQKKYKCFQEQQLVLQNWLIQKIDFGSNMFWVPKNLVGFPKSR